MNILIAMNICGSILFLLYLMGRPLMDRLISAKYQQIFLKVTILFFLLPFQYFKNEYFLFFNMLSGADHSVNPIYEDTVMYQAYNHIFLDENGIYHLPYQRILTTVLALWLAAAAVYVIIHVIRYFSFSQKLDRLAEQPDADAQQISEHCVNMVFQDKKKNIRFCRCRFLPIPFVSDKLHPLVCIPEDLDNHEVELSVLHELCHIRNHDSLFKFLISAVILLHWYNPLVYLLFAAYGDVSEKSCDEQVLKLLDENGRKRYGNLIVYSAEKEHKDISILFADTFIKNHNQMKARIQFMSRKKPSGKLTVLSTAVLSLIAALTLPLSVLAYQPPLVMDIAESDDIDHITMSVYVPDSAAVPLNYDPFLTEAVFDPVIDFSSSDEVFVDENGNQYPISSDGQAVVYGCSHTFASGTVYSHEKNGNGCTVYTYSCSRCTKCGYITNKTLTSYTNYPSCPH